MVGFFIGILVIFGLRFALYSYVYIPDRALWKSKGEMIDKYKYKDGDIIIVGSSRAMAINPVQLHQKYHVRAYNFSVGGATTPSTYFFVKRILDENPGARKLYIELTPINMTYQDTSLNASLGENFLRYVATSEEASELDTAFPGAMEKYKRIHRFPFEDYVNIKDISLLEKTLIRLRSGVSDNSYMSQITVCDGFLLYPEKNIFTTEQNRIFEKKADDYYQKICRYTESLPPVTGLYFNKLVDLLAKRKVDYVFFFSPIPNIRKKYNHLAFGETYKLFQKVENKVNDKVLLMDNKFFSEPSHVNSFGSSQYTEFFYMCVMDGNCSSFNTINLFEHKS